MFFSHNRAESKGRAAYLLSTGKPISCKWEQSEGQYCKRLPSTSVALCAILPYIITVCNKKSIKVTSKNEKFFHFVFFCDEFWKKLPKRA